MKSGTRVVATSLINDLGILVKNVLAVSLTPENYKGHLHNNCVEGRVSFERRGYLLFSATNYYRYPDKLELQLKLPFTPAVKCWFYLHNLLAIA
jgi:hypothetical protein